MTAWITGVRGRVTLSVLAVTAVVYSLLGTIGFLQIAHSGRDAIEDRITDVLDDLETTIRSGSTTVSLSTADGVEAVVMLPAESPLAESEGVVLVQRPIEVEGQDLLLVGRSSEARLTDSLRSLYRGLWIAIPLASVISALLAGRATRRALRPVGAITELAATIGTSSDGARVPVPDTGDEIERLALTVNEMLDRIDRSRTAQRQFTSDAAHELRTPLMALQGELELVDGRPDRLDDDLLHRLATLTGRLGDRIDDLVLLSTLDEDRPIELAPTSLLALARDEAGIVDPSIAVSGVDVEVPLDQRLVARALRNLCANARRHAADAVTVTVEATADRVSCHVDDDGPGIPEDRRQEMFRRFTRLDEARSTDTGGSGLGLAIVASVAAAHAGGVSVSDAPLGGTRVTFWLPQPNETGTITA